MKKIILLILALSTLHVFGQDFPFDKSGEILSQILVDGVWTNAQKDVYTYIPDADGVCKEQYINTYTWDLENSMWKDYSRYTYTYTPEENEVSVLLEIAAENEEWVLNSLKTMTYSDSDQLLSELEESYSNGIANPNTLKTYEYNAEDELNSLQFQIWDFEAMVWVNNWLTLYEYDDSGEVSATVFQSWNADLEEWTNLLRTENTYEPNLLIQSHFTYSEGELILASRNTKDLNDDGKITYDLREFWNANASIWIAIESVTNTYDTNSGVLLSKTYENVFDIDSGVFTPTLSKAYSEHCSFVSISEASDFSSGILLYSNPGSDLHMSLKGFNQEYVEIQVMDMNGKIVYVKKGTFEDNQRIDISLENMSGGLYNIRVIGTERVLTEKWQKL